MNRLGVYYGFLASSEAVDWHDCLRRAKAAGAGVLEMSAPRLRALAKNERQAIVSHARELGISATLVTALTPEAEISSPDAGIHKAGVASLLKDIELAYEIGAATLGGILTAPGKHFPQGIEHHRREALENCARGLGEAGRAAGEAGVTLALEVVDRFETPLVNTAAQALELVRAVNLPSVGIHLDTFHMNIEEDDIAAAIRSSKGHLAHFHVCENNRKLPGQAHVPWANVFQALDDIAYTGRIVIESLPGPYGSIATRLNIWRTLVSDVDAELAQSIEFLKGFLEKKNV